MESIEELKQEVINLTKALQTLVPEMKSLKDRIIKLESKKK